MKSTSIIHNQNLKHGIDISFLVVNKTLTDRHACTNFGSEHLTDPSKSTSPQQATAPYWGDNDL